MRCVCRSLLLPIRSRFLTWATRRAGTLSALLDAQHHLSLHDKMGRLKQAIVRQPVEQSRLAIPADAQNQPRRRFVYLFEIEPPGPGARYTWRAVHRLITSIAA